MTNHDFFTCDFNLVQKETVIASSQFAFHNKAGQLSKSKIVDIIKEIHRFPSGTEIEIFNLKQHTMDEFIKIPHIANNEKYLAELMSIK